MKSFVYITLTTILLFLAGDLLYSSLSDPQKIAHAGRVKSEIYHHDLLPDFDGITSYGPIIYRLCTDGSGFRIHCDKASQKNENKKNFDIAFIGDSFTEGIGLPYEDTFVGFFTENKPGLSVANLGVASYSPAIYYTKIKHLLEQGYKFRHIVVFPDASDIQDEATYYKISNNVVVDRYDKAQRNAAAYVDPQIGIDEEQRSWALRAWLHFKDRHDKHFTLTIRTVESLLRSADAMLRSKAATEGNYYEFRPMNDRGKWTYSTELSSYGELGIQGGIESALVYMKKLSDLLRENNIQMSVGVYPWEEQLRHDPLKRNNRAVTLWKEFCEREQCANFINASDTFFDEVERIGVDSTIQKYRGFKFKVQHPVLGC